MSSSNFQNLITSPPIQAPLTASKMWLDEIVFPPPAHRPRQALRHRHPPPECHRPLHLGHAINDTLQDVLIRAHACGDKTSGSPASITLASPQRPSSKNNLRKRRPHPPRPRPRSSRQTHLGMKRKIRRSHPISTGTLGCSCDWYHTRFTFDDQSASRPRNIF